MKKILLVMIISLLIISGCNKENYVNNKSDKTSEIGDKEDKTLKKATQKLDCKKIFLFCSQVMFTAQ